MAYQPHTLLTFGGHLNSGSDSEIWQCGIRVFAFDLASGQGTGSPVPNLAGYLSDISGGITSWFTTTANGLRNDATLEWLKAANLAPSGLYSGTTDASGGVNPAILAVAANTHGGSPGAGSPSHPPILTCAMSFRTSIARGPGSHGRIYPPLSLALANTERLSSGNQTTVVNSAKALLTAISKPNTAGNPSKYIFPVVASKSGQLTKISEVRAGDVVDVQRRRKNALKENYAKSAWS